MVVAVEMASGALPFVIGKPQPHLLEVAARAAGVPVAEAVMIGDQPATDIGAARAVGARSILMLTGVTTREQAEALPPALRPTEIAADAKELAEALARLAASDLPTGR